MKCIKKLVAVLLTAVMAMSLLTACGGGGGGASNGVTNKSNEVTDAINAELKKQGVNIQLTYDKATEQTLATAYTKYAEILKDVPNPTSDQKSQARSEAFKAAGVKSPYLRGTKSYKGTESDMQKIETSIAATIKEVYDESHVNYKKIGFATLFDTNGQPYELWYLVVE